MRVARVALQVVVLTRRLGNNNVLSAAVNLSHRCFTRPLQAPFWPERRDVPTNTVTTIFRFLSVLPLSWLHALGAFAGWVVWWSSAAYRQRMRDNLAQALGEVPDDVRCAAIAGAGRQMMELPFVWVRPLDEVMKRVVRVEGRELLEAARADGASVLMLTPHLGCFEICAQYCATHGPITVLYRPPRKAALRPVMEHGRTRGTVRVAPADVSGVRRLLKALRSGEMVGMLPDQAPQQGEGVWSPFFGRPAWTMTLAARLSEVKNTRVLMIWTERLPRGEGWVVHVSEPVETIEGDLEARCAGINREIERLILRCPGQYLWGYNRYKVPKGVEPPPESAL